MGLCSHLGFLNILYPHNTFCVGTIRDHLEDGIASHKLSLFVLTIVCFFSCCTKMPSEILCLKAGVQIRGFQAKLGP